MIGGKTIISEEVFADLVKTAMSKVESVAVSTGEGSTFAVIAKKVADRVVPQVNVKKTDAVTGEGEQVTIGHGNEGNDAFWYCGLGLGCNFCC